MIISKKERHYINKKLNKFKKIPKLNSSKAKERLNPEMLSMKRIRRNRKG